MVHSHFTLCSRVRDYLKRLSQHLWYGLWIRVKGCQPKTHTLDCVLVQVGNMYLASVKLLPLSHSSHL